eukprot:CAMPEP_0183305994 /NCGR_PEP_ID=MMETSP0160_2-20130417/10555_1 /TAXON_ID=2839 ORGANISM="Odontella Sinensis, Strain Grunow 1884" /NCGR_SAMPLE_ID=MMETSP0160_2 /ASSEMBLY_ACC=CAM_ASM_000250 /LENGTH=166 /DNA_ID=CAMNT_0025469289 /DNA_START=115 /DNA_END=615 /DNA_ORIENTATION=-
MSEKQIRRERDDEPEPEILGAEVLTKKARMSKDMDKADAEKKERRLAANRKSAHKSRYRKMVYLEEMKKTENEMKIKNEALEKENEALRQHLHILSKTSLQLRETGKEAPLEVTSTSSLLPPSGKISHGTHELSVPLSNPKSPATNGEIQSSLFTRNCFQSHGTTP